jgi:Heterokaryon incompatibility protein (HET)
MRPRVILSTQPNNILMDAQSLPEYRYEPLCAPDAVRVVVLKPAKVFEDPLRCDIIQYSRSEFLCNPDNTAHYTAVSYTWGEPVFSEHILCNSDSSIVRITTNANSLLRHLRKQHVARYLWIDAICMNEGDAVEKAEQIPLMGKIYETAKKVRIWLGDADEDTAKVFAFLRSAHSDYAEDPKVVDLILGLLQNVFGYTPVDEIENFLRRLWFCRLWVIQEAMSALHTTAHCGNNSMPFPWFTAAFKVLRAAADVRNERFQLSEKAIEALEVVNILSDPDISVMELLWKCHASDCRDPQDRVLSFYGLMSPEAASKVPFDYNSHWAEFFR